jgi:putative FmdB family regulatory protein
MPIYTYRREDGTTFDVKQRFVDEPLTVDPESGQRVSRVVQAAGVIFKGSGFYINDSKSSSKSTMSTPPKKDGETKTETPAAPAAKTETTSTASTTPQVAAAD